MARPPACQLILSAAKSPLKLSFTLSNFRIADHTLEEAKKELVAKLG